MTRRTISFIVAVTVDEDAMREREEHDPAAWQIVTGALGVAFETIARDNLDLALDADVRVAAGTTGIDYQIGGSR